MKRRQSAKGVPDWLQVSLVERPHPQRRIELHRMLQSKLGDFDRTKLALVAGELKVE
jgi:hypothetical protein